MAALNPISAKVSCLYEIPKISIINRPLYIARFAEVFDGPRSSFCLAATSMQGFFC